MRLSPFQLHRPRTVEEAVEILEDLGPDALPYCGGTELLLVAKLGLTEFRHLVDLKGIGELRGVEAIGGTAELRGVGADGGVGDLRGGQADGAVGELRGVEANGGLRIGAATTHREIERSEVVRSRWPSLASMERLVGNIRVRNVGTIGGNLCFADPHSDPATYLIAAGGSVTARGSGGSRQIPVEEFTRGPYETALGPAELVTAVQVPEPPPGSVLVHRKMAFHERPAITISIRLTGRDGAVAEATVAAGSVGVAAQRLTETEQSLLGLRIEVPDSKSLAESAATAGTEAQPVEDANGSVEYKRQLVRVLSTRCLQDALAQLSSRGADRG